MNIRINRSRHDDSGAEGDPERGRSWLKIAQAALTVRHYVRKECSHRSLEPCSDEEALFKHMRMKDAQARRLRRELMRHVWRHDTLPPDQTTASLPMLFSLSTTAATLSVRGCLSLIDNESEVYQLLSYRPRGTSHRVRT